MPFQTDQPVTKPQFAPPSHEPDLEAPPGGTVRRLATYLAESVRELWVRPPHQVPALDGLRAMAILLVICAHFFGFFWTEHVKEAVPGMASLPMFNWGWTGVDLFFVLSGYLIGKQLWRERATTGTVRFWPFILRRGMRIWPLFYAMILFYTVTRHHVKTSGWDFVFLTNFHRGVGFDDAWSLSTEEQFYILVPLLLILTASVRRFSMYFLGLAGVIVLEWVSRAYVMHGLSAQGLQGRALLDAMHYPIHLHADGLIAGLAIALLSERRPARFRAPKDAGVSWLGLGICLGATAIGVALRMANKTVFAFTALGLLYGGLTLWMLWDRSVLTSPARWRIWYPISRLSYGMYLNNYVILPGITYWAFVTARRASGSMIAGCLVGLLAGTLVSMGVATVTFILVERPFLILRDRVLHRRVHMHAAPGKEGYPAPVSS
jgi:peptidoglycan/LPS O-acetylase OafA/YrhL